MHVLEATTNETLRVEDRVLGVHSSLVLGGITDQTLLVGEGNERGGGVRTLVVGNYNQSVGDSVILREKIRTDLDIGALVVGNARVGGA